MANLSKNQKANALKIKEGSKYAITEALVLVKDCASAKFDESVDVSINLGIDTKKSDQNVRNVVGKREMRLSAARARKDRTLHISSIVKVRE